MRVLNVGHHYHVRGGADRYMIGLEQLLGSRGHDVVPFTARSPENRESPWAEHFPPGVDAEDPGPGDLTRYFYSLPARRAMRGILEGAEPDLAHLHIYYGQLTASILDPLREAGVPVVQSLHEYKLACPVYTFVSRGEICEACRGRRFWHALPRRCKDGSVTRTAASVLEAYISKWAGDAEKVDHFIAVSDFMREKMIEHGVTGPGRITTLHNFVDPARLEPAERPGEVLLYFGRIAPVKGIETLIQAAAPLEETNVVIVGEGPQRAELAAMVEERGIDHVRFVGFRSGQELHEWVRRAIAVVLPAEWYENCPMSVLESMGLGRPVIGARIGGIPELIEDREDGWLFPSGDVEALRNRMRAVARDPRQAHRMGRAARRKVERAFSPDVHYERLMDIYEAVL